MELLHAQPVRLVTEINKDEFHRVVRREGDRMGKLRKNCNTIDIYKVCCVSAFSFGRGSPPSPSISSLLLARLLGAAGHLLLCSRFCAPSCSEAILSCAEYRPVIHHLCRVCTAMMHW